MFDLIITSGKQYCSVFAVEDVNSGTAALYILIKHYEQKVLLIHDRTSYINEVLSIALNFKVKPFSDKFRGKRAEVFYIPLVCSNFPFKRKCFSLRSRSGTADNSCLRSFLFDVCHLSINHSL